MTTKSADSSRSIRLRRRLLRKYGPGAVVLGAAEGIGRAYAEELAAAGFGLLLADRRSDSQEELALDLSRRFGITVRTLCIDFAEPHPWESLKAALDGEDWGLVIYNAAASPIGSFLDLDPQAARRTVAVNVSAPLEVVHGAGNVLRRRFAETGRRGGIILMSSLSGLRGTPTVSAYAATKAWNLVLAEGVAEESRTEGLDVMACVAGATDTPGYRGGLDGGSTGAPVQSPESVVREALSKLGRRSMMIPGRLNRLIAAIAYGLLPRRWGSRIIGRATANLIPRDDVAH